MEIKKRIGFISYGRRKRELIKWVERNAQKLRPHDLYATGIMGQLMIVKSGLSVNRLNSKRLGGDQQLVDMIANGELDILFLFWDSMNKTSQDIKTRMLLCMAVMYNVVVVSNVASADFVLTSSAMAQTYQPSVRSVENEYCRMMANPLYLDAG